MKRNTRYLNQTLAAALIGLAACGTEPPTAAEPAAPLQISAEERAGLQLAIDDAVTRLIPALQDLVAANALSQALTGVAEQLSSGGQKGFDQSVERAQSVLARFDGGGSTKPGSVEVEEAVGPDAPVIAMIRLTMSQVAAVASGRRTADGAER